MCVCVCSLHADCPKAKKGARPGFIVYPPSWYCGVRGGEAWGYGVWECGEGRFGVGCVVSGARMCGGIFFRGLGQKASITRPPGNPLPK